MTIGPSTLTARISLWLHRQVDLPQEVSLKHSARLLVAVFVLTAFAGAAFSADEKEKAATDAAAQWLVVVDSGQYGESWFQAASAFRNAVSKEQWKNAMDSTRAPLGKVLSRQFKSATYAIKCPTCRRASMSSFNMKPASSMRVEWLRPSRRCWRKTVSGKCRDTTPGVQEAKGGSAGLQYGEKRCFCARL